MSDYEESLKLLEDKFGNGKDNIIALSTIALDLNAGNSPKPQLFVVWMRIMKIIHFI